MIYHGVNPAATSFRSFLSYIRLFEPVMLEAERRESASNGWWEG